MANIFYSTFLNVFLFLPRFNVFYFSWNVFYIYEVGYIPVFFNLFDAAEPHTSVKVTHGTPCAKNDFFSINEHMISLQLD